jgi:hypothetical protein
MNLNSVRLWVVLLAATSFLAGLSAGMALSRPAPTVERSDEPFHDYRVALTREFELDAERSRLFGELLRNYQRDLDASRERVLAASRSQLEPELAELGLRYRQLIRDHVVPPVRRGDFDTLARRWDPIQ